MKITICGSIDFKDKMLEVYDQLIKLGHEVLLPRTIKRVLAGEIDWQEHVENKGSKEHGDYVAKEDLIKRHWEKVKDSEAILVINEEKKGIKGYIGANTFLEMGFALVLDKKIFVLYELPEESQYIDELRGMKAVIINNDLNLVK